MRVSTRSLRHVPHWVLVDNRNGQCIGGLGGQVRYAARDCIPMYKNLQSAKNVRKVDINTTPSKITVSNVNWVLHNPTKDLRIVLVVRQVRIAMLLNHRYYINTTDNEHSGAMLTVNGYSPSCSVREIINTILNKVLLGRRCSATNLIERAATIFMSHCWGATFGDLIGAASHGARKNRRVWIDIFAVRQWPGNEADLNFRDVINCCDEM